VRTLLLANNRLGARIGRALKERGDLVAVVLHPEARRTCGDELVELSDAVLVWPDGLESAARLECECLLSVLFGYIVPEPWLRLPSWRALNLHPALLPYNRGSAPNVWPIVDGTPAGTTLHEMTPQLDAGGILAQRQVAVEDTDTAETLYRRLEDASFELFDEVWDRITDIEPVPQTNGGTYHRMADLTSLDLTDTDLPTLDKLRARTFPPYGAEFERAGRRYRARVVIEPID